MNPPGCDMFYSVAFILLLKAYTLHWWSTSEAVLKCFYKGHLRLSFRNCSHNFFCFSSVGHRDLAVKCKRHGNNHPIITRLCLYRFLKLYQATRVLKQYIHWCAPLVFQGILNLQTLLKTFCCCGLLSCHLRKHNRKMCINVLYF